MTADQLREAKETIGQLTGWGTKHGMNYSAAIFRRDLEALHPGLVKSEFQMRRALAGAIAIPGAWEKVVVELVDRAAHRRIPPPSRGPFYTVRGWDA